MKYHFVLNGYSDECLKQMQEQRRFQKKYLSEMEEGEAYIYGPDEISVEKIGYSHAEEAVLLESHQYIPETILDTFCRCVDPEDLYIFGSDFSSIELAVRTAERMQGSSVTSVHELCEEDPIRVKKMLYSNHMEGTFEMKRGPFCISLAKGMERDNVNDRKFIIKKRIVCDSYRGHIVSCEFYPEKLEEGLEDAKIVVAAGRGAKNKDNIAVIKRVTEVLGGEFGVSRPAAMNAWAPMNRLIGVSGAMIGPDICITAGVSGALAFYAGIEKSKFIVAINTDEKAPIMKMPDGAVVDDFLPVLKGLEEIIAKENK